MKPVTGQAKAPPPVVFAPVKLVGSVGDIDVYLVTVESWGGHVRVRLAASGRQDPAVARARHDAAMVEWSERQLALRRAGRQGEARADWPPPTDGNRIAEMTRCEVTDDVGTAYRWVQGASGGSGSENLSEADFEPAWPDDAEVLAVTVVTPGDAVTVTLARRQ
jgi:hypothetical protein